MMADIPEEHRTACKVAARARDVGARKIAEGVKLLDVAEEVENTIFDMGAAPAFPVNLSLDTIAAHYTPHCGDETVFEKGSLVKMDVGAHVEGYIGDTATTVEVGTSRWSKLTQAAKEALESAIDMAGPGVSTRDLGRVIERSICSYGLQPIKNLTGHGLGRYDLHSEPSIPNFPEGPDFRLREGMVVAIEPFSTTGKGYVRGERGGSIYRLIRNREPKSKSLYQTYTTIKEMYPLLPFAQRWLAAGQPELKKLSKLGIIAEYDILVEATNGMVAQEEHTILITEGGCEVLTRT